MAASGKGKKGRRIFLEYEKLHINSEFCNGPYFIQNFVLCTTHFICRALEVEFTHLFLDAEKQNPVKFGTVSRNVGHNWLKDIHRKFDNQTIADDFKESITICTITESTEANGYYCKKYNKYILIIHNRSAEPSQSR